ncbi:DUF2793 domain-containing protein [Sphingomonas sp.]|uniref:DUF2793 domain-containing protein n=1 Tax=Sphingomonas sp. TaxID=28214 RepID=UPI003B00C9E7
MSDTSPRFSLPLLAAGQAQKELFHNEALTIVDAIVHPLALTIGDAAPPAAPVPGQCWIVGASPVGAWAGRAATLAAWTEGGWRFVVPVEGMAVWIAAEGLEARFEGGAWTLGEVIARRLLIGGVQVVGARAPRIAAPSGGTNSDQQSRDAIAAIIAVLSGHGLTAN